MSSLVFMIGGDILTATDAVATATGNDHASVIKLVRNYQSDFEEFGRVRFEIQPFATAGGQQEREVAFLNEQQATLLLTYMRNNEVVRKFKKRLVKAFYGLIGDVRRHRSIAAASYKLMNRTLQVSRSKEGKTCAPHHFMNEARLVNQVLLGKFKGIDRDALDVSQLDKLGELEVQNTILIAGGMSYAERKVKLAAMLPELFQSETTPKQIKGGKA
jgi:phage regulator Rha-like protein